MRYTLIVDIASANDLVHIHSLEQLKLVLAGPCRLVLATPSFPQNVLLVAPSSIIIGFRDKFPYI